METIVLNGKQDFLGKEIPVIYGGFGENHKCICDKTIAEIHKMETFNIRARITENIRRFKENIDFIDLKKGICEIKTFELLINLGYAKTAITQAEHIYILSERGYAKLIKIMDSDLAWDIHDRLMDEYFQLREEKEKMIEVMLDNPDFLIKALIELKESRKNTELLNRKNLILQKEIEEDRPKVLFAESVSNSDDLMLIRGLAKLIKQNGVDIGEKRLYAWLRKGNYLISKKGSDYNMPTQKSMDLGLFKVVEGVINSNNGFIMTTRTTKVTGKGQEYFINKFIKMKEEMQVLNS